MRKAVPTTHTSAEKSAGAEQQRGEIYRFSKGVGNGCYKFREKLYNFIFLYNR
jgi:hypothetical protein